jgi:hypothetical protein
VLGLTSEEAKEKPYIASMGIYVFKKKALMELLNDKFPNDLDFGGEIIPKAAKGGYKTQAYLFNGYWEDIGTIKSFFEANLAMAKQPPRFEFYDPMFPIYTESHFLPPANVSGTTMQVHIYDRLSFHIYIICPPCPIFRWNSHVFSHVSLSLSLSFSLSYVYLRTCKRTSITQNQTCVNLFLSFSLFDPDDVIPETRRGGDPPRPFFLVTLYIYICIYAGYHRGEWKRDPGVEAQGLFDRTAVPGGGWV